MVAPPCRGLEIGDGHDNRNFVNTISAHRAGRLTTVPTSQASNAALLIDFDNVTLGVRSDLTRELRHLLDSDIIKGKVSVQRAYADWRRYPQYIVPLSESSIDLIFAPAFGTNKKNATDIRLAIDATELVFTRPEIGTFILLSGDSDFSSLVIKLKEYGKYVIGVGIRESASDILIQNCDEYFSYSELAGLTREEDTPSTQRDPWELVVEAIDKMVANGDVMRADRLKQVMQQIDHNFDESNAGFSRFSKFIQEAGVKGLIKVEKLESGQYEVAPIGGSGDSAGKGSERKPGGSRRGRRGSRSRSGAKPTSGESAATTKATEKPDDKKTKSAEPAEKPASESSSRRRKRGGRGRARATTSTTAQAAPAEARGLTLAEAFHLIGRALRELPAPVAHETLRARMAALLGREDPLLGEDVFLRLLRQANDAEVAEVRKIDDNHFEVSPHKTDLALQGRSTGTAEGAKPATATVSAQRTSTGVRYRAGNAATRSNGVVPLVGVVKIDDGSAATTDEAPVEPASEPAAASAAPEKPSRKRRSRHRKKSKSAATAKQPAGDEPASGTVRAQHVAPAKSDAAPKKPAKESARKSVKKSTRKRKTATKKAAKKSARKPAQDKEPASDSARAQDVAPAKREAASKKSPKASTRKSPKKSAAKSAKKTTKKSSRKRTRKKSASKPKAE